MAQIIADKVKLDNGQLITPNQGGWYDGRQYWGGTLSEPGQINSLSNQQGAGQQVSREVVAQTNPNNVAYIEQQRKQQNLPAFSNSAAGVGAPTGVSGGDGSGVPGGVSLNQPTINLPSIYKNLYDSSGIQGKQDQLSQMERDYIKASGEINDNPFLAEASRVGRIAKLDELFQKRTANLRGDIATAKADIEMQLNLQTKQFDIDSQASQLALSQFNTLLGMGALDNASGDDIASITRSTGLSSGMIRSAIDANKQKNVQTSTIQFDDGQNTGYAIINSKTGEILNKQVIAASKPSSSGGSSTTSNYSKTSDKYIDKALSILKDVDKSAGFTDHLLSSAEADRALKQIMGLVGDKAEAEAIFTRAVQTGGYRAYGK